MLHTEKHDRTYVRKFSVFNRVMKHVASKARFPVQIMNNNSKMYALRGERKSAPELLGIKYIFYAFRQSCLFNVFFYIKRRTNQNIATAFQFIRPE